MNELLADAFDRSERLRCATPASVRKQRGQYFTAPALAEFMASLLRRGSDDRVRILDPGAGTGILGIAAATATMANGVSAVELVAIEPEAGARRQLAESLARASRVLGPGFRARVLDRDFLTAVSSADASRLQAFDVVIGNPPYFKMSPSDPRGGDSPNAYTRFMEVAADLLVDGGQLCFVVPRSFASGAYFRGFRRDFHRRMSLLHAHVFESRRAAFQGDGVLQENVVVLYRKRSEQAEVEVSSSGGIEDLRDCRTIRVPWSTVFDPTAADGPLALPTSPDDLRVLECVRAWNHRLGDLGLAVSTGPVVPFRATSHLRSASEADATVPLLWMQHVTSAGVRWPWGVAFRKPEYLSASAPDELLLASSTYVLLRRFSAKEERKRLTAAPLLAGTLPGARLGLENHLNFVHRPGGSMTPDEAVGLSALLNGSILDAYFRIVSGSTQVNAGDLRVLPVPAPAEIAVIGRLIRARGLDPARAMAQGLDSQ